MGIKPYLIFSLHHNRYAIAAKSVTEIFLLPELIPVAEAPPDVVGLLNLHSVFVPVMHLDLRFGHRFEQCHLSDSVIIVESNRLQIGVIVHQVETVNNIDDSYIQADLSYGRERNIERAFVKGIINLDDEMIVLLDVDNLVRHPDALARLLDSEDTSEDEDQIAKNNFYDRCFVNASANIKDILRQRAANLKQATDVAAAIELVAIAIVSINGRYFGLDLDIVREFINIRRVTNVPCCPEHIIGNINLRGEILTLVDISQFLNLGAIERSSKAVVIEVNDVIAGIVVEEIYDIVDFRPEELKPVPVGINGDTKTYIKRIADYRNRTLSLIDFEQLVAEGVMTVELTA